LGQRHACRMRQQQRSGRVGNVCFARQCHSLQLAVNFN
jgi:hypothetical protein